VKGLVFIYCIGVVVAGFLAAVKGSGDFCDYPETKPPLVTRLALFGAAVLWPLVLAAGAVVCLAAAVYSAPIATVKLWRKVRDEALKQAEGLEK
jgi:hypothetical protein